METAFLTFVISLMAFYAIDINTELYFIGIIACIAILYTKKYSLKKNIELYQKVYIDGSPTPLDDSFIPEKMIGSYGPYTVPENCYFMLGDNRNDSKDSRSWKNKFVRFDRIVGKAVVRYYPSFKWLG